MHPDAQVTPGQIKSGILWITGLHVFRDGLQFALTLLLVRLLDAKAYGEFSLVNACLSLFTVFSLRSFLEHTLQIRPGEPVDYQAHFTWGAVTQPVAVLATVGASVILRRFPESAAASTPLLVMSVYFMLDWASELRVKMLERQLNWSRLRLLEAAGLCASACISIVLAFWEAGVFALLAPLLFTLFPFAADLFGPGKWRPNWTFHWSSYRASWRYGLTRIASGAVARGQQLLESTFIVGWLGLSAFGVYGRALGFATLVCLKLTSVLTVTIFPVLTRYQPGSPQFQRASALVIRVIAWTSIPAAAILALTAREVVPVLYGKNWSGMVPLLPWALAVTVATALTEGAALLLLANLQPQRTLAIDGLVLAGSTASLLGLLPKGVIPYLAGMAASQLAAAALTTFWLYKGGALQGRAILAALLPPVLITGALSAVFYQALARLTQTPLTLLAIVAWFLCYLAALRVLFAGDLAEILEWVPAGHWFRRALWYR